MIADEHQDLHPVEPRHRATLPARQPRDQVLQPAEAAGRLGQLPLALDHRGGGGIIAVRHRAARGRKCLDADKLAHIEPSSEETGAIA